MWKLLNKIVRSKTTGSLILLMKYKNAFTEKSNLICIVKILYYWRLRDVDIFNVIIDEIKIRKIILKEILLKKTNKKAIGDTLEIEQCKIESG